MANYEKFKEIYLKIRKGIIKSLTNFFKKVDNEKINYSNNYNYKELKSLLEQIEELEEPQNMYKLKEAINKLLFLEENAVKPNQDKLISKINFDKVTKGMKIFKVEYK